MKSIVTRAVLLTLSSAVVSAMVFADDAYAERQGAPIVYAGQVPNEPSAELNRPAQPQSSGQPSLTTDARVSFRYPGEVAGPGRSVSTLTPPASKMILQPVTRAAQATPSVTDTALAVPGLAMQAAPAPAQPIRIASVQVQQPANTGKPLTLSRVKVNRDAPMGEERGLAGIYMDGFDGQPTANGEIFDDTAMTAAHPSLPLPSLVQVINEENGREVVVRVNDRGPFDGKRMLELSPRAGTVLGMRANSSANVRVRYLGPAPVKQNEDTFAPTRVDAESLPPVTLAATPQPLREPSLPVAEYSNPGPSPAPRVETVRASAPVAMGNVFIQAGAFADISNAQRLTSALGRGHSVKIEEARINGGNFFRVLIGPFPDRQAADLYRAQLSNAGIVDGFLTTR